MRIVEAAWLRHPHPDLADAYAHVKLGDSARQRLVRVETLAAKAPGHIESALAVARNLISSKPDDAPPADPATTPPLEVAVGLATSFDNRYLSVAGNLGSLSTFDLTAGTSIGVNCACSPTSLYGMGESLFRLTSLSDGDVKVFDAASNEVWFVPLAMPAMPPAIAAAANGGPQ